MNNNKIMTITTADGFHKKKADLLTQIVELKRRATKNKALLSLKYENLLKYINWIQVSVIVFSTVITLLESVKGILSLNGIEWDIIPIGISTYITIIMAILRFYKWETQKENISKCHESHTNIINKLEKTYNVILNFNWYNNCEEKWENIVLAFEDELFDNFVSAKETFENILSYKDIIYYKKKFTNLYLQMEFNNQDIDLIRRGSSLPHNEYTKKNNCFLRKCCCYPKESLDVKKFLWTAYNKFGVPRDQESLNSGSSSSTYVRYIDDKDVPLNRYKSSSDNGSISSLNRSNYETSNKTKLDPIREEPIITAINENNTELVESVNNSLDEIGNIVHEMGKVKKKHPVKTDILSNTASDRVRTSIVSTDLESSEDKSSQV